MFEDPEDQLVTEGDTNIRIPCESFAQRTDNPRVTIWRVNGIDYTISDLPPQYTQTFSSLRIDRIARDLDGTSFQCLLPSDDDLSVEESPIGIITVRLTNGMTLILYTWL